MCVKCQGNQCCHLEYSSIDGYITDVDLILFKFNNLDIPLPKPVLTITEDDAYLSCGYATKEGCLLGNLRSRTCVTSNCELFKNSFSESHKKMLENNGDHLKKIEYTLNSVLNDLTEDFFTPTEKIIKNINDSIIKNKNYTYKGEGIFSVDKFVYL